MDEKHGVTAIIFVERNSNRLFLVLHRILNWSGWEFVKGGIDPGENPRETVLREILEETGLRRISIVAELPKKYSWTADRTRYVYVPFLVKADTREKISLEQEVMEHDSYRWVPQEEVEKFLTHEDNRRIFREALSLLW